MSLVARIEALIEERGLTAGVRLPSERTLAAELGVSRSRLREAMQQLISRGIVASRQGGGTFVIDRSAALSLDAALKPFEPLVRAEASYWRDVLEIRKSLDADAAYYAALRAGDDDKERLRAVLGAVSLAGSADPAVHARADANFHMAIAEASHNAVLRQVVAGLSSLLMQSITESLTALYRLPSTVEALDRQHRGIADAIFAGRADDAHKAALDHLVFVEDSLRLIEDEAARTRRAMAFRNTSLREDTTP